METRKGSIQPDKLKQVTGKRSAHSAYSVKAMADWISTKKAMQLLGVGSTTIKRWADQNKLPFIRTIGGHRRFRRDSIEQFLRQQSTPFKNATIAEWIDLLTNESDIIRIRREVENLHRRLGDW